MSINIIAIIPARGGSKRIPGKNTRFLANKPLISYTIEAAKRSKLFNRIVVSTDDDKLAEISRGAGAEVLVRPSELAEDTTLMLPVIKHAIEKFEGVVDIIVILQPTSPLKNFEDIDETIKLVLGGADSAQTFCEIREHPEYMFNINQDNKAIPLDKENLNKRSQDLGKKYIENGAVFVLKKEVLMNNTLYGVNHKGFVMPRERSIDIDDEYDLKMAEKIIEDHKND